MLILIIEFTYEQDDGLARSWPDHFLCSSAFLSNVSGVSKFTFGTNLSNHHPLIATIDIDCLSVNNDNLSSDSNAAPRSSSIAWHKVCRTELDAFCELIAERIPPFSNDVFKCVNPHCIEHHAYPESYIQSFVYALDSSAQTLCLSLVLLWLPVNPAGTTSVKILSIRRIGGILCGLTLVLLVQEYCTN